jgi:hypothetical protein
MACAGARQPNRDAFGQCGAISNRRSDDFAQLMPVETVLAKSARTSAALALIQLKKNQGLK